MILVKSLISHVCCLQGDLPVLCLVLPGMDLLSLTLSSFLSADCRSSDTD